MNHISLPNHFINSDYAKTVPSHDQAKLTSLISFYPIFGIIGWSYAPIKKTKAEIVGLPNSDLIVGLFGLVFFFFSSAATMNVH